MKSHHRVPPFSPELSAPSLCQTRAWSENLRARLSARMGRNQPTSKRAPMTTCPPLTPQHREPSQAPPRAYAAELAHTLDAETERRQALHRVLDHYLHTARN